MTEHDPVNHPSHYTSSPSGIEVIEIAELLPFCQGNAVKYLCRAGLKGDWREDLAKCRWYMKRAFDEPWAIVLSDLDNVAGGERVRALAEVYSRHMRKCAGEALIAVIDNDSDTFFECVADLEAELEEEEGK